MHTDTTASQTPYTYIAQLLKLDRCRPPVPADLPKHIQTPAIIEAWTKELAGHPDQQFARYILQDLTQGFHIGFDHSLSRLQQAGGNMLITDPRVVLEYIAAELSANRLVELSAKEAASLNVHCSPIGIVPTSQENGI